MNKKKLIVSITVIVVIITIGIVGYNVLKCDYSKNCDNFRIKNSKYCYAHTCEETGCNYKKDKSEDYCVKHKYEIEIGTFDAITGAELINVDDRTDDKYGMIYVYYYYKGADTRAESLELFREYTDYIDNKYDFELVEKYSDKYNAHYRINLTSSLMIELKEDNTIQVFVTD